MAGLQDQKMIEAALKKAQAVSPRTELVTINVQDAEGNVTQQQVPVSIATLQIQDRAARALEAIAGLLQNVNILLAPGSEVPDDANEYAPFQEDEDGNISVVPTIDAAQDEGYPHETPGD